MPTSGCAAGSTRWPSSRCAPARSGTRRYAQRDRGADATRSSRVGRSLRVKSKLQRINPQEQPDEHARLFGELIALESYHRGLRERATGRPDGAVHPPRAAARRASCSSSTRRRAGRLVGGHAEDGSVVAATSFGLVVAVPGRTRGGCAGSTSSRSVWRDGALTLVEADVEDDILLVDRPPVSVSLARPRDLPPVVRKRVEANIVQSELLRIGGGAVRFVARRLPGQDGLALVGPARAVDAGHRAGARGDQGAAGDPARRVIGRQRPEAVDRRAVLAARGAGDLRGEHAASPAASSGRPAPARRRRRIGRSGCRRRGGRRARCPRSARARPGCRARNLRRRRRDWTVSPRCSPRPGMVGPTLTRGRPAHPVGYSGPVALPGSAQSPIAQLAEHSTVNRRVSGSSPDGGADEAGPARLVARPPA